jgi:protein SCO1
VRTRKPGALPIAWLVLATRLLFVSLLLTSNGWAAQRYSATGLVVDVDLPHQSLAISCQTIPGYMDGMVMPFSVHDPKVLMGLSPGMMVDFTLVAGRDSVYAENIRVRNFESAEQDPFTAHQLKNLQGLVAPGTSASKALSIGDSVPDFKLVDQNRQPITLHQFAGKVVAVNFIYTRCALPQFCFRLANSFANLQKHFAARMGRDLVLLTVSFDPVHDQPEVLAEAAKTWKADARTWHFLTGPLPDVKQLCGRFGVEAWTDEGLMIHSLHTVIIDRHGKLAANLEGNQFTAQQLGDLVETVMNHN